MPKRNGQTIEGNGNDSDEIQYYGFQRVDVTKSEKHKQQLEEEGIVYTGCHDTKIFRPRRVPARKKVAPTVTLIDLTSDGEDGQHQQTAVSGALVRPTLMSVPEAKPTPEVRATQTLPAYWDSVTKSDDTTQKEQCDAPPGSSIRAKRSRPSGFKVGPPVKRKKKDDKPAITASDRSRKRPHEPSASTLPHEVFVIDDSSDEEPPSKRPNVRSSSLVPSASESRAQSTSDWETWLDDEYPKLIPEAFDGDSSYDSEEDYDTLHHGYDLSDSSSWKPVLTGQATSIVDDELADRMVLLDMSARSAKVASSHNKRVRGQIQAFRISPPCLIPEGDSMGYRSHAFIWTELRAHIAQLWQYHGPHRHRDVFSMWRGLQSLSAIHHAPGPINQISQCNGVISIAGAAVEGDEDPPDTPDDCVPMSPFNREGTLAVWCKSRCHILRGHERNLNLSTEVTKHYTVQDVQFDPVNPTRLVSSGTDHRVQIWDCEQIEDGVAPRLRNSVLYGCTMASLLFKPGDSFLAMGGWDGCVYLRSQDMSARAKDRLAVATGATHEISDMAWGRANSADMLFASSGVRGEGVYAGCHKAFDMRTLKTVCKFDAGEDGEKIAVDNSGISEFSHSLQLYDARRLIPRTVCKVDMEPFRGDVTTAKYSPDGIYLAISRTDNTTHVYDSRFLRRGVLHIFTHDAGNVAPKDAFGVVKAAWVEGSQRAPGLISGGSDGCIRLWDVRRASDDPSNGSVLAECQYDISYFALGNPYKNEKPLVVGENGGTVTVYDRTGRLDF